MSATPPMPRQAATTAAIELVRRHGGSRYGGEAVSQLEHALQAATRAADEGASSALIAAALLHDIGHLLHDLPDGFPKRGIDDQHELLGARWLAERYEPAVVEPVKLHVAAKRYLCTVDADYFSKLSGPSRTSLAFQGGPMTADEVREFESGAFAQDAVQLRRWDEAAKIPLHKTPPIEHFAVHLDACVSAKANP